MQGPLAIDFETTDKDPLKALPVEVALYGKLWEDEKLINPGVSIPIETSAIHHITDEDVIDAKPWEEVKPWLNKIIHQMEPAILIAHNAEYEQGVMREIAHEAVWICTYKCALVAWPDAPSHKNEVLRYMLKLPDLGRAGMQKAHSALHDARVTFQIYEKLSAMYDLPTMIQISKEPKRFPKIPFGKHVGTTWDKIPGDYLGWICKQVDMDKDIVFCARGELDQRRMRSAVTKSN